MKTCKKCEQEFETWVKIDDKYRNLNNRRYCLDCLPFKSNKRIKQEGGIHLCQICKKETNARRKNCGACNTKIRRYRNKKRAIELLGGECNRCSFKGHQCAFEFHHKDPLKKSFTIGVVANKNWASIEKEVQKCELLCSNCHRIEHSNRDDPKFLEVANRK